MDYVIKNSDESVDGNDPKNIFIALKNNQYIGHSYVYPLINFELNLAEPYNLYIELIVSNEVSEIVKEDLFKKAIERAKELREEHQELKARIYGGCLEYEEEKLIYYLSKGFYYDDGKYIFEKSLGNEVEETVNFPIIENSFSNEYMLDEFIDLHNQIFTTKITLDKFIAYSKEPLWTNFSVYFDNELIGNIMIYQKDGVGHIENLLVRKQFRKLGIAKALITKAMSYFQFNGIAKVQLEVWGRNQVAVNFYKKLGFQFIRETEMYPGINL